MTKAMSDKTIQMDKTTEVLLELLKCTRSHPSAMGRRMGIPRTTATHHIKKLEDSDIVKGYTPIVDPGVFGQSYLVKIILDSDQYRFESEIEQTVEGLNTFFRQEPEQAFLSFYVIKEDGKWEVCCITLTDKIETIRDRIYRQMNIAREDIQIIDLEIADGVPTYNRHSILTDNQEIGDRGA